MNETDKPEKPEKRGSGNGAPRAVVGVRGGTTATRLLTDREIVAFKMEANRIYRTKMAGGEVVLPMFFPVPVLKNA